MFYEIVNNLCKERKTTITRMAEAIGLSNAAPTSWRKGAVPKLTTLEKIAEYFDVSVDYLRGVETKKTPTPKGERDYLAIMNAFDKADESTREAILLLLKLK
jgi:transcriptional regulator with XRE-family HTH domain